MKRNLLKILLCFISIKSFSQDEIYRKDGAVMIVKIKDTSSVKITYTYINDSAKKVYAIAKSDLLYIKYQNGSTQIFNENKKGGIKTRFTFDEEELEKHRLSFSVNIVQLPINEIGMYVDSCFIQWHSIGIQGVYIYANSFSRWHAENNGTIAANHALTVFLRNYDWNPGFVYYGYTARLNYKYCFAVSKHYSRGRNSYVALQVLYKSESYHGQTFRDVYKYRYADFVRNEETTVLGVDILFGYRPMPPNSKFNVEVFVGPGIRYRERNITTLLTTYGYNYNGPKHPEGTEKRTVTFPIVHAGIKVGINTFFK